jgi:hypothetical protein
MIKFLVIPITFVLSGCSYFTFNASMCEQIAADPHATMPQECKDYDEKKADKAFNKVVNEKKVADKDIQFDKEEEE